MTDDGLGRLLRAALPPIAPAGVTKDAWPAIDARLDSRTAWTLLDIAVAAVVTIGVALIPNALFVIALHL